MGQPIDPGDHWHGAAVLPNIGGSLPNHVFEDILGLPTLWIPHSYPGCLQHAPNEHMLESIAREGLQIACGLFYDLGRSHSGTIAPRQALPLPRPEPIH